MAVSPQAEQAQNIVVYDGPLLSWAQAASAADLSTDRGSRFNHGLIDAHQASNPRQTSIVLTHKPNGHGRTVFGGAAQPIHATDALPQPS